MTKFNSWMIIEEGCYLPRKGSCGRVVTRYFLRDGVYSTEEEAKTVADSLPRKEHGAWGYGGTYGEKFTVVPEEIVLLIKKLNGDDKERALGKLYAQSQYAQPPWTDSR